MKPALTKTRLLAVALALGALVPCAMAGFQPIGDPIAGDSWAQRFVYDGSTAGAIDLVAVQMIHGGPFESPTFREFTPIDGSWGILWELPPSATPWIASAWTDPAAPNYNPTESLSFDLWFVSDEWDPLGFMITAFQPGAQAPVETATMEWDGAAWTITSDYWDITRQEIVCIPAPGAVLLGVVGLGLVGTLKRPRT